MSVNIQNGYIRIADIPKLGVIPMKIKGKEKNESLY